MRTQFVNTSNVKRFHTALSALEKRGAEEACLAVVDGVPGLGKTTSIKHWAIQNGCPYVRCKSKFNTNWLLIEVLKHFNVQPPHSYRKMFAEVQKLLSARQMRAEHSGQFFALVLDEVDHISRSFEMMETIRDLSDTLEVPVILVGMGRLRTNLAKFPQIASRVGQYVEFQPATEEDVRKLVDGLCEIPVADDLVKFVHRVSKGLNREIKEAIAQMERFGKRRMEPGSVLTLRDMENQPIMNDRDTSKAILVPEVV